MDTPVMDQLPKLTAAFSEVEDRFPHKLAQDYLRLARKIEDLWGSREVMPYLDSLMLSERSGRQGFTAEVLDELAFLKQLHEYLYPDISRNPYDPFAAASFSLLDLKAKKEAGKATKARRKAAAAPEAAPASSAPAPQAVVRPTVQPGPGGAHKWPELKSVEELHVVLEERRAGRISPERDPRKLGEILQGVGLVDEKTIQTALKIQQRSNRQPQPVGQILVALGALTQEDVVFALCVQSGTLIVDVVQFPISPETMMKIPANVARAKEAVPVAILDRTLFLAVNDPLSFTDRKFFSFLTDLNVELCAAARNKLILRLNAYGQVGSAKEGDAEFRRLAKRAFDGLPGGERNGANGINGGYADAAAAAPAISQDDATVVGLVNKMITDAAACSASDIHLEAFPGVAVTRIRFRRDGMMEDYSEFPSDYHEAVVSRIKIMADLDISEKRKPQDGKISFPRPGMNRLDLRVATIPTLRGIEAVTIRLLPGGEPLPLDAIGMGGADLARFRAIMEKPYGLIVVCGPTGSGKTTTLHSVLRELNRPNRKIWTAEDPIEIVQKNICQVQVNPKIDFTFANALRSFLRADPDVIMIGEMRDTETAHIAVEASMTGHLVLTTLHTNSAAETAARLLDLEVDPFNLSDAILGILAQRLVRRVCRKCGVRTELKTAEVEELAAEYHYSATARTPSFRERDAIITGWRDRFGQDGKLTVMRAVGCRECTGTGYRGRMALFELLVASPAIRVLVRGHASAAEFLEAAIGEGMKTLKQDGIEKILQGLTDAHQVRGACM